MLNMLENRSLTDAPHLSQRYAVWGPLTLLLCTLPVLHLSGSTFEHHIASLALLSTLVPSILLGRAPYARKGKIDRDKDRQIGKILCTAG